MRRSRASSARLPAGLRRDSRGRWPGAGERPAGSAFVELTLTLSAPAADLVSTLLFESGATAITVAEGSCLRLRTHLPGDSTLRAHLARVRRYLGSLRSLGVDTGPAKLVTRCYYDRGWATRWKEFFRPVWIGGRLVIKPSWDRTIVKPGVIRVELDPGMAFGTGQHPTTRMCLELLEEAMEQMRVHSSEFRVHGRRLPGLQRGSLNYELRPMNHPPAVLDLGTGSGLLAIAAFRYGAGTVLALDTDSVACQVASENIRRNGGDGRIIVKHGSLEVARRRTFDMVLANLTSEQLISLAPRLERSMRPIGRLITSGILGTQERGVAAAFRGRGLILERVRRGGGWSALMFRRPAACPHGLP